MWSDNETTQDLLGYQVHADLLKKIILMMPCCLSQLECLAIGALEKAV